MSAPDFCTVTQRRARKEHWCCECNEDIRAGDEYVVTVGFWEGKPDEWKQCLRCRAVWDSLVSYLDERDSLDDGIHFTRLHEEAAEALRDDWEWPVPWEMPAFMKEVRR